MRFHVISGDFDEMMFHHLFPSIIINIITECTCVKLALSLIFQMHAFEFALFNFGNFI